MTPGRLLIEIADDGIPFNILTRDEPDLDSGIEERSVGGLGIFFVRRLVQEIRYRREGGRNILTLTVDPRRSRRTEGCLLQSLAAVR